MRIPLLRSAAGLLNFHEKPAATPAGFFVRGFLARFAWVFRSLRTATLLDYASCASTQVECAKAINKIAIFCEFAVLSAALRLYYGWYQNLGHFVRRRP